MVRQNPYQKTDQCAIYRYIKEHSIVTCPFGHTEDYSELTAAGVYAESECPVDGWLSGGQDRSFVESIAVGDTVVIPFVDKAKRLIIAKITSDAIGPTVFSGLHVVKKNGDTYRITDTDGARPYQGKANHQTDPWQFRPVHRKIKILSDVDLPSRSVLPLPIKTLSRIKNRELIGSIDTYLEPSSPSPTIRTSDSGKTGALDYNEPVTE
jgi:hypothetical protein